MDITLMVMLPPRGATSIDEGAGNSNYRIGSIIQVLPYQGTGVVSSQVTGFLHVTGAPNDLNLPKIKSELESQWEDLDVDGRPTAVQSKRAWIIPPSILTGPEKLAIVANRQLTITAARFAAGVRKKAQAAGIDISQFRG